MTRCYECKYYTEKSYLRKRGVCMDRREGRKPIKVRADDYCPDAVHKETKQV